MKRGYFKMYWELMERLSPEASMLLSYLIEIEPIVKNKDGDFFRLANSFIQETFQTWSSYVIKSKIDELTQKGYIEVRENYQQEHGTKCKTRWVKITDLTDNLIKDLNKDLINDLTEKFGIKDNKENKENKENKDIYKHCYLHNNGETSSPVVTKTTSSTKTTSANNLTENETISYNEPQAHLNQFDEIKSYVLQLTSINDETKDYLLGWIEQNISSKSLTVNQLRAILKDLYQHCNNDLDLVSQSIKEAYLKSWKNFYVPKNVPVEKKQYSIEKPEEKQEIAEPVVITDLHSFLNT